MTLISVPLKKDIPNMGIFGKTHTHTGFTIVELIIVITVIAILAGIALVAYPGYQMRTRDNERKSDLTQVATALNTYALQKNSFITAGCGKTGAGNGWLSADSSQSPGLGGYPKSIVTCLQESKLLSGGVFADPTGCTYNSGGTCGTDPVKAYMKATCTKSGVSVTYVLAYLESLPQKETEVDALCDNGTVAGFTTAEQKWGSLFGMNYYLAVK